jgi:hypothetical protein
VVEGPALKRLLAAVAVAAVALMVAAVVVPTPTSMSRAVIIRRAKSNSRSAKSNALLTSQTAALAAVGLLTVVFDVLHVATAA